MKLIPRILVGVLCICSGAVVAADEGMWLFNAFPSAKVYATYGFEPTQAWLDHVRLSSVRFPDGSGSFVSPDGLTFTNHHIAADCIHDLSTASVDYMKRGFYAKTEAEEHKCPDMSIDVLVGIDDVTQQINAPVAPAMDQAEAGQARRAAMASAEKDCSTGGLHCDVVTLYAGGMYHLYKYKKYTDVRLVFAPEFDVAFFGGDPDNFEYPRYDLDISFFRIYDNGRPLHVDDYFRWSKRGASDGELVFVSGNPGSTGRLLSMAQLEFLRDVQYPWQLASYKRRIAMLEDFSRQSAENARIAQEDLFTLQNSQKAITGYQSGLLDTSLMAGKSDAERKLQQFVSSDPARQAVFHNPWADLQIAMNTEREIFKPFTFLERRAGFRGTLAGIARDLIRAAEERPKPNGERLREYRDSALPGVEQGLFSTALIYKSLETAMLAEGFEELRDAFGATDPIVTRVLAGSTPAARATDIISGTKLDDVAVRRALYMGGPAAIQASTDPMIALMRAIDPDARAVRTRYDDEVDAVERQAGSAIAKVRFAAEGPTVAPDATFTLRLSYGAVRGYVEDGRGVAAAGTRLPYFTTIGGAFHHAADHGNKPPYTLPKSWFNAKSKLRLDTPLNTVSTPDIIGGNSGSPVIDKNAEIVGIIFDGNIQSLPWDFAYDDAFGRSLSVDSRGIIEALRTIYGAGALVDELLGTGRPK